MKLNINGIVFSQIANEVVVFVTRVHGKEDYHLHFLGTDDYIVVDDVFMSREDAIRVAHVVLDRLRLGCSLQVSLLESHLSFEGDGLQDADKFGVYDTRRLRIYSHGSASPNDIIPPDLASLADALVDEEFETLP